MSQRYVEIALGAIVLFATIFFFAKAIDEREQIGSSNEISMTFDSVSGLSVGNPVKIGGMQVGKVTEIEINPKTLQIDVIVEINDNLDIPVDSSASIASDGLLSGRHVLITPGNERESLEDGAELANTVTSLSLEELLARAVFVLGDI